MTRPYRRFRSYVLRFLLIVATLLVGEQARLDAGEPDAISARMQKFIAAGGISGAVTLVRHRGSSSLRHPQNSPKAPPRVTRAQRLVAPTPRGALPIYPV